MSAHGVHARLDKVPCACAKLAMAIIATVTANGVPHVAFTSKLHADGAPRPSYIGRLMRHHASRVHSELRERGHHLTLRYGFSDRGPGTSHHACIFIAQEPAS